MGLDNKLLETYRQKLLAVLTDIEHQDGLGQQGQSTVTFDQQSVGRLSRMDAMQQQAMAMATQARRDQSRLRATAALSRMEQGEYGYCINCGDQIAAGRLDFDPTIPNCVTCARG